MEKEDKETIFFSDGMGAHFWALPWHASQEIYFQCFIL